MRRKFKGMFGLSISLLLFCFLVSCAGPTVTAPVATSTKPVEKTKVTTEDLMLVDQLLLNGKFDQAVRMLQELQQLEPQNLVVQEKLQQAAGELKFSESQSLMALGAYEEALKKIRGALDLLPGDPRLLLAQDEANLRLGQQYMDFLEVEKAREALSLVSFDQNLRLQAQTMLTTDLPALEYTKKGYAALAQNDYAMALGYFKAALQLKPGLEKALSGQKAAETMIASRPTSIPTYIPPTGSLPTYTELPPSSPSPQPTEETGSWEKPEFPSIPTDWSTFKEWLESEIDRLVEGSSINENPILEFQNQSLQEDPQAYSYLSESDFANSLYLSALKVYGERTLYLASEIPRLFPLPTSLDPQFNVTQKRIARLTRDVNFVREGLAGLKPPTILRETHFQLSQLIEAEANALSSIWSGMIFDPQGINQLSLLSQAYVDAFDKAQAAVLFVPFEQLPRWAQMKKYYIETTLNGYMLNEVARDFEDLLPLPRVFPTGTPIYSPSVSFGNIRAQLRASNATPRVNEELTMTLIAFNTSSATIFATIRTSLPSSVSLIDQGAGSFSLEDGQARLVWDRILLPPQTVSSTASEERRFSEFDFKVKVKEEALGKSLDFQIWITGQREQMTPFVSSGGLSLQLGVDKVFVRPEDLLDYTCQLISSNSLPIDFQLNFSLPGNATLVSTNPPASAFNQFMGQLSWTGTAAPGSTNLFEVKVQVNPSSSLDSLNAYAQVILGGATALTTPNLMVSVVREEQPVESVKTLSLPVGTGAEPGYRSTLAEVVRLVRYSENLQFNIATTRTPTDLDQVSQENLKRAAKELASSLYWIPIKWASLSQLPYEYFVGYPKYSSGDLDAPNAQSLFDPVTGLVDKDPTSFLTISADLTYHFGNPDQWKDMIEWLRAQLLQRLAEIGYR